MYTSAVSDMAFSEEEYGQGTGCSQEHDAGNSFWKCFSEWKERTLMPEEEQQEVMERIEHLIEIRVEGIMNANRRNYYGECAGFIAAYGEVKESRGEPAGKQSFMEMYRQKYSRRTAFRQELRAFGYRG